MSKQGKQTVLVVDDIKSFINILVDILSDTYEVSVALDGEAALEIVQILPPDLILLDIMMPGMDGFEFLKCLKASPATADIPVIILSAKTEVEDWFRGLEMGAVDYLTKPFNIPDVKTCIAKHISAGKGKETNTNRD